MIAPPPLAPNCVMDFSSLLCSGVFFLLGYLDFSPLPCYHWRVRYHSNDDDNHCSSAGPYHHFHSGLLLLERLLHGDILRAWVCMFSKYLSNSMRLPTSWANIDFRLSTVGLEYGDHRILLSRDMSVRLHAGMLKPSECWYHHRDSSNVLSEVYPTTKPQRNRTGNLMHTYCENKKQFVYLSNRNLLAVVFHE